MDASAHLAFVTQRRRNAARLVAIRAVAALAWSAAARAAPAGAGGTRVRGGEVWSVVAAGHETCG
ncbi:MAG: hypothetical protein FJ090_15750 [Deltaproteobacteria bacterium]|nr:hypothetical protein [Deltaproteobacteria bacterium]